MSSFNKVILLGRLTRDPELRVTQNGNNICKFGLATSRKFKAGDGEMKEETTFVDVDAFGRPAELIAKFFTKGKPIFVEGRLRLDQWEGQNGEKRSKLSVVMEGFQFVGGSRDDDGQYSDSSGGYEQASPPVRNNQAASKTNQAADEGFDEDVPF